MPDALSRANADELLRHEREALLAAHRDPDAGLSLSGGGIRSAAFHLGVLQALAAARRLGEFGYLSTVSGGGYIGAWLAGLVRRHGLTATEARIAPGRSPEADEIRFLRAYSSFLTPRRGLLTADTWTVFAIWMRNATLNLVLFGLTLAAVLALPHAATELLGAPLPPALAGGWPGWGATAVFLLLVLTAAVVLVRGLTQLAPPGRTHCGAGEPATTVSSPRDPRLGNAAVQAGFALPLLLAAALAAAGIYRDRPNLSLLHWMLGGVGIYFESCLLGWLAAGCPGYRRQVPVGLDARRHRRAWRSFLVCAIPAGAVGGAAMECCVRAWAALARHPHLGWLAHARGVLAFGPAAVVLAFVIAGVAHVGMIGREFPDGRREWWSRAGAWLLIYTLLWTVLFSCALFSSDLLRLHPLAFAGAAPAWLAASGWGLLLARGRGAGPYGGERALAPAVQALVKLVPYVFVAGALPALSIAVTTASHHLPIGVAAFFAGWFQTVGLASRGACWIGAALLFAAAAQLLALRVDINAFSLHHLYRNRLVRTFLGPRQDRLTPTNVDPNRQRWPNPFTGFDPCDDLPLHALDLPGYPGPYPIFNAALNLVHGGRLAWQERKAESFVFTPGRCGYQPPSGADGYYPTEQFGGAGGPSLGVAMAVSGAALSPNMGAYSSPAVSALMALLDIRLGLWAGNPTQGEVRRSGPRNGLLCLFAELLGLTTDQSPYVYLSDGGHFENLGVYELVRRRCRLIVACDAGCDTGHRFFDLGNAIRKCRVDFGVEITATLGGVAPSPVPGDPLDGRLSPSHYDCFALRYPDGTAGRLIYLRATLVRAENADLRAYALANPDFPDRTTADQNFDESKFESYRALGQAAMQEVLDAGALTKTAAARA